MSAWLRTAMLICGVGCILNSTNFRSRHTFWDSWPTPASVGFEVTGWLLIVAAILADPDPFDD